MDRRGLASPGALAAESEAELAALTGRTPEPEDAPAAAPPAEALPEAAWREASAPFVGRWSRLVSTTNWEKGRILNDWRRALADSGASAWDYSDEAWARRVGGVTGQHVGRLRRVFARFGAAHPQYAGLYWSHFFAALDWHDAEMWLEGAVQNGWSVSQMRRTRWEAVAGPDETAPREEETVTGELDEDFEPALREAPAPASGERRGEEPRLPRDAAAGPLHEGPDFGDDPARTGSPGATAAPPQWLEPASLPPPPAFRPFEALPELPEDLAEAVDGLKLALLRHKAAGWREAPLDGVLAWLDALKALAAAPSGETAPF